MKRKLFLLSLITAIFPLFIHAAMRQGHGPSEAGMPNAGEDYVKVYISRIENGVGKCAINGLEVPSDKSVKPVRPLLIPFISIGTYLKQYTSRQVYTPQGALEVLTPYGQYRLWASESGVMYAPDPEDDRASHDSWKAKKLLSVTREEHGGKKLYLASLVLRAIKDKSHTNKLKVSLEPLRQS